MKLGGITMKDFLKPEYYENRELSWLKFDARVLNEARDKSIPLLEISYAHDP